MMMSSSSASSASSSSSLDQSYARLGRRWRRAARPRGFRLCPRNRFSVRRLRANLLTLLGLVGRYARLLVRKLSSSSNSGGACPRSGSTRALVGGSVGQRWCRSAATPRRAASFMRTNSFYAQAIAECLEFIKRNSVPVEDHGSVDVDVGAAGR